MSGGYFDVSYSSVVRDLVDELSAMLDPFTKQRDYLDYKAFDIFYRNGPYYTNGNGERTKLPNFSEDITLEEYAMVIKTIKLLYKVLAHLTALDYYEAGDTSSIDIDKRLEYFDKEASLAIESIDKHLDQYKEYYNAED